MSPKVGSSAQALALCSEVLTLPLAPPKRISAFGLIHTGDCKEGSTRRKICRILSNAVRIGLGQRSA